MINLKANAKQILMVSTLAVSAMVTTACTTTGAVEKNTAAGAVLGAAAGAVIGNNVGDGDAEVGAAAGALLGGLAGAVKGNNEDYQRDGGTSLKQPANGDTLIYDQNAGRYFFVDDATGRTYWQNGALRSR